MTKLKQILIAVLLSLLAVSTSNAMLIMTVTDGTNTIVAKDTDGDGLLKLDDSFGSWKITSNIGSTNPSVGNDYLDLMHLHSYNVSGGVGNLKVMLTQIDFDQGNYQVNVGGTTHGSLDFAAYADLLNNEFGMTTELYKASFGSGAFMGSRSGSIIDDSYSTTLVANISHTGAGQITSFDFEIKIPEPALMGLMGLALLVLGFVGRLQRRRS